MRVRDVKPVSPELSIEPTASIVLMRNYSLVGAGVYFWPTLNGEDMAGLYTNEHTIFSLSQGEYLFGVRCRGAWTYQWELDELNAKVQAGKTYYYFQDRTQSCVG